MNVFVFVVVVVVVVFKKGSELGRETLFSFTRPIERPFCR